MGPTSLNSNALDTAIPWRDEDTKKVQKIDTIFYIADTSEPAVLALPSCSMLGIVHLNCSVQLRKHSQPIKLPKEREKSNRIRRISRQSTLAII